MRRAVPASRCCPCVPDGSRRLGATSHANGGLLLPELPLPPPEIRRRCNRTAAGSRPDRNRRGSG